MISAIFGFFSGLSPKVYEILAVLVALAAFGGYMYYRGGVSPRAERDAAIASFEAFQAQVRDLGEKAQKAADERTKADKLAKEVADRENSTRIAAMQRTISQLRHDRDSAGSSALPASPPGSVRPDLACFDRGEYQRAYGAFISGLRGLADEGTAATIDLDTAKTWTQSP